MGKVIDYNKEVEEVMRALWDSARMFTVYDITRILNNKLQGGIDHTTVRFVVERFFHTGNFPKHWTRDIGYQLSFSPPPQIYYSKLVHDYNKYDANALDPQKKLPKAVTKKPPVCMPAKSTVIASQVSDVITSTVFAAKSVSSDRWLAARTRLDRITADLSKASLYKNRGAATQLIKKNDVDGQFKVVEYIVQFSPVNVVRASG